MTKKMQLELPRSSNRQNVEIVIDGDEIVLRHTSRHPRRRHRALTWHLPRSNVTHNLLKLRHAGVCDDRAAAKDFNLENNHHVTSFDDNICNLNCMHTQPFNTLNNLINHFIHALKKSRNTLSELYMFRFISLERWVYFSFDYEFHSF